MALKALMLRKQIDASKKALEAFNEKGAELEKRSAELEASIEEAETEEEQAVVTEAIEEFEAEKKAHDEEKERLERAISDMENELEEEESEEVAPEIEKKEERKEEKKMENRGKFFGMNAQERDAFIGREDVQGFLSEVRTAIKEKRSITNAGYLIPTVVIDLLRENVMDYSKLYKHAFVRRVAGQGRMVIEGTIPEAVWTEMCANLNELDLSFSQIEVDGYKVGGYFRVCNAVLEDSDIDLAAELIRVLGQAIGFALDKAILYGTGTKMPTGVLPSLDQTHIVTHAASVTGTDLVKALIGDAALMRSVYSRGAKVWCMNGATYSKIVAESLSVNAAGALVAGVDGSMPVVGGVIEVLNFIPDDVIIAGYFDLYLLAERAGTVINTSEHAFWIEDQTGFKGTARYDGKVLDADAFVAIGINGATPDASDVTFAQDTANTGA